MNIQSHTWINISGNICMNMISHICMTKTWYEHNIQGRHSYIKSDV